MIGRPSKECEIRAMFHGVLCGVMQVLSSYLQFSCHVYRWLTRVQNFIIFHHTKSIMKYLVGSVTPESFRRLLDENIEILKVVIFQLQYSNIPISLGYCNLDVTNLTPPPPK